MTITPHGRRTPRGVIIHDGVKHPIAVLNIQLVVFARSLRDGFAGGGTVGLRFFNFDVCDVSSDSFGAPGSAKIDLACRDLAELGPKSLGGRNTSRFQTESRCRDVECRRRDSRPQRHSSGSSAICFETPPGQLLIFRASIFLSTVRLPISSNSGPGISSCSQRFSPITFVYILQTGGEAERVIQSTVSVSQIAN